MSFVLGFMCCFVCFLLAGAYRLHKKAQRYPNDTCSLDETTIAVVRDEKGKVKTYAY